MATKISNRLVFQVRGSSQDSSHNNVLKKKSAAHRKFVAQILSGDLKSCQLICFPCQHLTNRRQPRPAQNRTPRFSNEYGRLFLARRQRDSRPLGRVSSYCSQHTVEHSPFLMQQEFPAQLTHRHQPRQEHQKIKAPAIMHRARRQWYS
jgi:hypothetical protein